VRRQVWDPGSLDRQNRLGDGFGKCDGEPGRSRSAACDPIEHPGAGVVVVRIPCMVLSRVAARMSVDEPCGVRVVRITVMRMLHGRKGEGEEHIRHNAEMQYAAHQKLYSITFTKAPPGACIL